MHSDYAVWDKLLQTGGAAGPDPVCGFFRAKRGRSGLFQVIAVFRRDGELVCVVGDKEVAPHNGWSIFAEAITEAEYRRIRAGGHFADEFQPSAAYRGNSPLVTDLRDARAIFPPTRGPHGTRHTDITE